MTKTPFKREASPFFDVRVREQIGIKDFSGRKNQIEKYFSEYLPEIKKYSNSKTLRDTDRYLWGESFYKNLKIFLKKGKLNFK